MKRALILMAALMLAVPTLADYDDAPDVQIVVVEVEHQIIADPPRMPIQPLQTYDWDPELIDALASIYWAETGANGTRTSQEKLMITQLIWNRAHHGNPFPDDLLAVCKQRGEFNKGRISDRNRTAARDNLNKVRSQAEGYYQGIPTAITLGIYMTREANTGILTFQDENWVTIYRVEE